MKKHIFRILGTLAVLAVLAAAFFYGDSGKEPSIQRDKTSELPQNPTASEVSAPLSPAEPPLLPTELPDREPPTEKPADAVSVTDTPSAAEPSEPDTPPPDVSPNVSPEVSPKDESNVPSDALPSQTEPIALPPMVTPDGDEPTDEEAEHTCFLTVRCDTVLANMDKLDAEKAELIPADGVLFAEREVVFYEEESVFNVLSREMKQNKIHFEFVRTPVFGSAYIEGIANLYEFDCGELSGWLYLVNGTFPGYGCSRYTLSDGDRVEVVYTCDSGADVGAAFEEGGGQKDA